jgi:FeS assembly SUF system protein
MTDDASRRPDGDSQGPSRDVIDVRGTSAPAPASAPPSGPLTKEEIARITDELVAALKTVYDPEIPVDIYELGLIYKVDISDDRVVTIDMTLTAPGCPVAGEMPGWVEAAARTIAGVADVKVNMVFEPPWDMSRMSDEARLQLNML